MKYLIKQALLNIKQAPLFSISVVTTLSLTFAALLSVVTIAYVMLVKPLPYPEQSRLVKVEFAQIDKTGDVNTRAFGYQSLMHLYKHHDAFDEVALVQYSEQIIHSLANFPVKYTSFVTPKWFDMFAMKMHLGRGFDDSERLNTHHPVAVISYQFWQNDYNSDANIIGKSIHINNVAFKVIGVVSNGFSEPELTRAGKSTDVWLPWDFNVAPEPTRAFWGNRGSSDHFVAKLPHGVNSQELAEKMSVFVDRVWQKNVSEIGFYQGWRVALEFYSLDTVILGDKGNTIMWLITAVIGLLVIATANMSNLFVARMVSRSKSIAIMGVVGAKQAVLFYQFFIESFLLTLIACVIALFLGQLFLSFIADHFALLLPRAQEIRLNWLSVSILFGVSLLLGLIFASLSVYLIQYRTLAKHLSSSGKGAGLQVSKSARSIMLTFQAAVASFLLVIASITLYKNSHEIFKAKQLKLDDLVSLNISTSSHLTGENRRNLLDEAVNKIANMPEVANVSRARSPFEDNMTTWSLIELSELTQILPVGKVVDAHYFKLMDQSLVSGDLFTDKQYGKDDNYLVINQTLNDQLGGNAVGKKLTFDISRGAEAAFTIIGVVENIDIPGQGSSLAKVFRARKGAANMIIEFKPGQYVTKERLNTQLQSLNSGLAVFSYESLDTQRDRALFRPYTTLIVSLGLIGVTIVLTGLGIFSVFRYAVLLRKNEIGVHMALGAKLASLVGIILKENSTALCTGFLISLVSLIVLYHQQPLGLTDDLNVELFIAVFISYAMTLLLVALASLWPLKRYITRPVQQLLRGDV